ncbi:kelch-like protein 9 [Watersipora subatra]|uniref:kelch-like protein 9 n=1 Tax=Watersipora subatra TaxID=2589382 RepID=UPI00355B5BB5
MSTGDLIHVDDNTELVKISNIKYRYLNTKFHKPTVKLSDHNADIKLKVGNEYFKAHKDVLSSASDYFSAMFSHDMMEKDKDYIELKGISLGGFQIMLEYFYHGHITLVMENVQHCLEASTFFHVDWLTGVCSNYIMRHLSVDNCLPMLSLADTYSLMDLVKDMYSFIGHQALRLMETSLVPELPYEVIEQLLAGDYYVDIQEESLLSLLIQWANFDFQSREPLLSKLLLHIKFHLMTPDELENIPEDLLKYDKIKDKVEMAKSLWQEPHKWSISNEELSGRGGREVLFLVSEWNANSVTLIDLNHPHVHSEEFGLLDQNSLADFTSLVACGGFLYAIGGYNMDLEPTNQLLMYDPRLRLWLQFPPMKRSRENFRVVTLGKKLYSIGGSSLTASQSATASLNEEGTRTAEDAESVQEAAGVVASRTVTLRSCESYDPEANKWTDIPSLPHGLFAHAACVHNGSIYVTGGVTDNLSDPVPVNYCYRWTPGESEWTRKASMLTRRQSHAMFSANNKIYVMGGYTAGDLQDLSLGMENCFKNEFYDAESDGWEAIADTPSQFGHIHKTVAIVEGVAYLLGGNQSSKYLHEFHLDDEELVQGAFCGKNLVQLVKLTAYYPSYMASDVPKSTEGSWQSEG